MAGMPDEQLIAQLAGRARAEGLRLTGEDGLLGRLTKVVVESALEGEMDDHVGYGKHDPAGRNGGNSRDGTRSKTLGSGRIGGQWAAGRSLTLVIPVWCSDPARRGVWSARG